MAEAATLARPYARAAFEHARGAEALARWSDVLATGAAAVADERVAALLGNPRVTDDELAAFVHGLAGERGDEQTGNFIRLLAHNGRLELLPEISAQFQALRAEVENIVDVELVSAIELDDAQRKRFTAALEQRLARSVRLQCSVDPALIGGAIVRAGDFVIDGSLRGKVERLGHAMTN